MMKQKKRNCCKAAWNCWFHGLHSWIRRLEKQLSHPVCKAALAAVLIVCVDLVSVACSQKSETISLESAEEIASSGGTEYGSSGNSSRGAEENGAAGKDDVSGDAETSGVITDSGSGARQSDPASESLNLGTVEDSGTGQTQSADTDSDEKAPTIYVYVCGAVEHAGVYELPEGTRVFEAVDAAGGFSLEADETAVNQALILGDQDQVYIPTREETEGNTESKSSVITGAGQSAGSNALSSAQMVNINTASQMELETLPGIGSTKAAAILEYRTQNGSFAVIEDLKKVSGIGDATFEKLKNYVTID